MINWILENKEWLFSGIAVTTLVAIFFLVRKFMFGSKTTASQVDYSLNQIPVSPPQTSVLTKLVELDLLKISKEIESLPPYQLKDARKHYIGLRFRYTGRLLSAEKHDKGKIRFMLESLNLAGRPLIFGTVSEDKNPQIKIAHKGTRITIEGDLSDFDSSTAGIENIEILVYEEEKAPNH